MAEYKANKAAVASQNYSVSSMNYLGAPNSANEPTIVTFFPFQISRFLYFESPNLY